MVSEFCVAELGAVLGISTVSAKKLIGHALELRHRLPRLWAQVQSGRVPAWRARSVAEATIHATPALTPQAAGWVDAQVAAVAGKIGPTQLDRLVAETIKRFELAGRSGRRSGGRLPVRRPASRHPQLRGRPLRRHPALRGRPRPRRRARPRPGARVRCGDPEGARVDAVPGCPAGCRARRPRPHPDRARPLHAGPHGSARERRPAGRARGRAPRPLRRHHRRRQRRCSARPAGSRKANAWSCSTRSRPGAATPAPRSRSSPSSTSTRPLAAPGYAVPDRIREVVILRDRTCVFPWCTRPARGCDLDHVTAYDHQADAESRPQPGPTSTDNLAALCRFHHRLKTYTGWTYRMVEPGVFEWTSPHGHHSDATTPAPAGSTTRIRPNDHDPAPHPAIHEMAGQRRVKNEVAGVGRPTPLVGCPADGGGSRFGSRSQRRSCARRRLSMSQRRARILALVTAAAVTLTVAGTQTVAEAGDRGAGTGQPSPGRPRSWSSSSTRSARRSSRSTTCTTSRR